MFIAIDRFRIALKLFDKEKYRPMHTECRIFKQYTLIKHLGPQQLPHLHVEQKMHTLLEHLRSSLVMVRELPFDF